MARVGKRHHPELASRTARLEAPSRAVSSVVNSQRPAHLVHHLQHTAGNAAVARLLRVSQTPRPVLQAKLMVGAANDPLEREADRVAHQVLRSWSSGRAGVRPEQVGDAPLRRLTGVCDASASAFDAGPFVAERLAARRGRGDALPPRLRDRMEAGFGADFSAVRIHRDVEAAQLSASLSARAFTHGREIYFGAGAYDPASRSGQHVLAHELTHVLQQRSAMDRRVALSETRPHPDGVQRMCGKPEHGRYGASKEASSCPQGSVGWAISFPLTGVTKWFGNFAGGNVGSFYQENRPLLQSPATRENVDEFTKRETKFFASQNFTTRIAASMLSQSQRTNLVLSSAERNQGKPAAPPVKPPEPLTHDLGYI